MKSFQPMLPEHVSNHYPATATAPTPPPPPAQAKFFQQRTMTELSPPPPTHVAKSKNCRPTKHRRHRPTTTTTTTATTKTNNHNNNKVEPYTGAPLPFWLWLLTPLVRPYTGSPFRHVHGPLPAGCAHFHRHFATTALSGVRTALAAFRLKLPVYDVRNLFHRLRARAETLRRARTSRMHPRPCSCARTPPVRTARAPRPSAPAHARARLRCAPDSRAHLSRARARTDPRAHAAPPPVRAQGAPAHGRLRPCALRVHLRTGGVPHAHVARARACARVRACVCTCRRGGWGG